VVTASLIAVAPRLYLAWLGAAHDGAALALRANAALALRGLAIASVLALASAMGTAIARGIARTDLEAQFAGVALALHVALALWLLPRLGLAGALIAITASNLVAVLFFLWRLAGVLRWPRAATVLTTHLRPAIAAGVGTLAGVALDRALPPASGVGAWIPVIAVAGTAAVVAAAVVFATRFLDVRELRGVLAPAGGPAWRA